MDEELFRILEGFPELAHDDEVDACSGALELLNHQMKVGASMNGRAEPRKIIWASGSLEWQAEQAESQAKSARELSGDSGGRPLNRPRDKSGV